MLMDDTNRMHARATLSATPSFPRDAFNLWTRVLAAVEQARSVSTRK
jgi:hypothetical protein